MSAPSPLRRARLVRCIQPYHAMLDCLGHVGLLRACLELSAGCSLCGGCFAKRHPSPRRVGFEVFCCSYMNSSVAVLLCCGAHRQHRADVSCRKCHRFASSLAPVFITAFESVLPCCSVLCQVDVVRREGVEGHLSVALRCQLELQLPDDAHTRCVYSVFYTDIPYMMSMHTWSRAPMFVHACVLQACVYQCMSLCVQAASHAGGQHHLYVRVLLHPSSHCHCRCTAAVAHVHVRVSGRTHVAITRMFPPLKTKVVSNFNSRQVGHRNGGMRVWAGSGCGR